MTIALFAVIPCKQRRSCLVRMFSMNIAFVCGLKIINLAPHADILCYKTLNLHKARTHLAGDGSLFLDSIGLEDVDSL